MAQMAYVERSTKNHYFLKYLEEKKQENNEKYEQKKGKNEKFKNSIKIQIENKELVTSKQVFEQIKLILQEETQDVKTMIKTIMQYKSNRTWVIEFYQTFNAELIVNRTISINNEKIKILSMKDDRPTVTNLTAILRIHWFPLQESRELIKNFLSQKIDSIQILDTINEQYRDEMEGIDNGIIRLKIKYNIEQQENILNLIGINRIEDNKVLIQLSGYPPKCLKCKKFGHLASECQTNNSYAASLIRTQGDTVTSEEISYIINENEKTNEENQHVEQHETRKEINEESAEISQEIQDYNTNLQTIERNNSNGKENKTNTTENDWYERETDLKENTNEQLKDTSLMSQPTIANMIDSLKRKKEVTQLENRTQFEDHEMEDQTDTANSTISSTGSPPNKK